MYINNETHILRYDKVVAKPTDWEYIRSLLICFTCSFILFIIVVLIELRNKNRFKYNYE